MDSLHHEDTDLFKLEIDEPIKSPFLEMARWTKFMAIMGFISIGFMLLGGISAAALISSVQRYNGLIAGLGAAGVLFLYIIIAAIMFYPVFALFKYSVTIKKALSTNNKQEFYAAINWLKNMFKYQGILLIIFLALFGIVFIFSMLGVMMNGV